MLVVLTACADVRPGPGPLAPATGASATHLRPLAAPIGALPAPWGEATVGCGDGSYASVGDALRAANPPRVVSICAGAYEEALRIEQDLTLEALDGEVTLKPADGALPILTVAGGATVAVDGLRFEAASLGPALRIEGGAAVEGTDLAFEDNSGGAVQVDGAAFTCARCELRHNGALGVVSGGAIHASAAEVTLEDARVSLNEGLDGGVLFAELGSTVTLSRCDVVGNSAVTGGVAHVSESALVLRQTDLVENEARTAAALHLVGATAEASGDPADLAHRGKISANVATAWLHGAVELYPSGAGVDSTFLSDDVQWTLGAPLLNPVDRNIEWDVFFGYVDPDGKSAWGYRFGATYNEATFACASDVAETYGYPGLCDL